MKLNMFLLLGSLALVSACEKETDALLEEDALIANEESAFKSSGYESAGYVHGLKVEIDGALYYFAGAPAGENGEVDVPGHSWVQAGKNRLVGKHYNTGPFGMSAWWSSDAADGALLYKVNCIIDTWTPEKSEYYASKGYVHYHEFISVEDGSTHPSLVPWLKHIAVTSFTFDGGPAVGNPDLIHEVTPGVDLSFPNNYMKPYLP